MYLHINLFPSIFTQNDSLKLKFGTPPNVGTAAEVDFTLLTRQPSATDLMFDQGLNLPRNQVCYRDEHSRAL